LTIEKCGMGQLIGGGHESRGLYYLETNPYVFPCSASSKLLQEHLSYPHLSKLINFWRLPKMKS